MTREQFIEQMTVIEDYLAAQREAGNVLNQTFFNDSTPSVFDFGNDLICLAVEQLSELSGIDSESIEDYLCDDSGIHTHSDRVVLNIKTSADLWDFEQHDQNKR